MAGILDLLGITGGQTPMDTNQTPILYDDTTGMGSMTAGAQEQPQGILGSVAENVGQPNKWIKAADLLGQGLMAAGSSDPSSAMLNIKRAQAQEAEANRPKVTPMANGLPFAWKVMPNGSVGIVDLNGNPVAPEDFQKYVDEKSARDVQLWQGKQLFKFDNQPLSAPEQKLKLEQNAGISAIEGDLKNIQSTLEYGENFKPGVGTQIAGTGIGRTIASLASGQSKDAAGAARMQQQIQKILATDWVKATEPLKGALSDREGARLAATQPLPTDDYETVIKPWMQALQKWLNEGLEKSKASAQRDLRTPPTSVRAQQNPAGNTSGNASKPKLVVPGLSEEASKFFD